MKSDSYLNLKTFKMSKLDFQNHFQPIVSRFMLDACKKHDMPHVLHKFQFNLVKSNPSLFYQLLAYSKWPLQSTCRDCQCRLSQKMCDSKRNMNKTLIILEIIFYWCLLLS